MKGEEGGEEDREKEEERGGGGEEEVGEGGGEGDEEGTGRGFKRDAGTLTGARDRDGKRLRGAARFVEGGGVVPVRSDTVARLQASGCSRCHGMLIPWRCLNSAGCHFSL